jgi:hypothetical protein
MPYLKIIDDVKPKNGAKIQRAAVIREGEYVVLCEFRGNWVTWVMDGQGNCFWGHYYSKSDPDGLKCAFASFRERVKVRRAMK